MNLLIVAMAGGSNMGKGLDSKFIASTVTRRGTAQDQCFRTPLDEMMEKRARNAKVACLVQRTIWSTILP